MGTDLVRLFDRRLSNEILSLAMEDIANFLEPRLHQLGNFSEFVCGFGMDVPAALRLEQLQHQGRTEEELKYDLVEHLCISVERLVLDYWACYIEVFSGDPPGSIPDYKLFPHLTEQRYLLLLAEHVDLMLESLDSHRSEVVVMSDADISTLRSWRDQCTADVGKMVAYFYNY
ncbi:MAG: hypothetical protein WBQ94_07960 [Terracidiphilus sp.]